MKIKRRKTGLSLIEMLIALPMLALVFMSIAYMVAVIGESTSFGIAQTKTQTAANNVLMLMKAEGYSKLGDILGFITTVDAEGKNIKVEGKEIPKDSIIHPDGITKLILSLEEKDSGADTQNINNKICIIKVKAPDFYDIQTEVKTISF